MIHVVFVNLQGLDSIDLHRRTDKSFFLDPPP
jgi:hypothetical protein